MSILKTLENLFEQELAAEGITRQLLDMVDLAVEYSPVIPFAGGQLEHAVKVRPWGFPPADQLPEKFEVDHPLVSNPVDQSLLKIMRARYLLARDARYGPMLRAQFERLTTESMN